MNYVVYIIYKRFARVRSLLTEISYIGFAFSYQFYFIKILDRVSISPSILTNILADPG